MLKFKKELLYRGYSKNNIEKYAICLGLFFVWYHGPISGLNKEVFYEFLLKLQEKGRSIKTINLYKKSFKVFCFYVLQESFLSYIRLSK